MENPDDILQKLFLGPISDRLAAFSKNEDMTLVHYTSAYALIEMLDKKSVWMRNARCMNDFSEVDYPVSFIRNYFSVEKRRTDFRDLCNGCHPGVYDEVSKLVDGHLGSIYNNTYITCLSEHSRRDHLNGRLSMWRGYGGNNVAAAVVIRKETVIGEGPYGLSGYPVQYLTEEQFFEELDERKEFLSKNRIEIATKNANDFRNSLFGMFQVFMATVKHPGFAEENEWRLLYLPNLYPSPGMESHRHQVVLDGMPQTIYKIPVDGLPINDGIAVTVDALVENVVIGPCVEASVAIAAMNDALKNAGHRNAERAIRFCGIPYRQKV